MNTKLDKGQMAAVAVKGIVGTNPRIKSHRGIVRANPMKIKDKTTNAGNPK